MNAADTNHLDRVTFTIDDISLTVPKGTTVYQAAKQLGIEIPIFCYLDRMPPFGACRMCLVEVEKMSKLQTSCTLEATEGMTVKTQSRIAAEGRKDIIEFLLINHPLDCPICDRAGECPLQDNALKYGPGLSRFFEEKRKFVKPLPLSPVLMLDRERCISCARCTRFSDLLSGDHALEFFDRGYKTEVGTTDEKAADSKFIGNTIKICPVGALTSNVYRFKARPWDNRSVETTCTLCPVGCSMALDTRDGEPVRTRSLEDPEVNDIWMCDKGWFGYEFADLKNRLQVPLIRKNGQLEPATWEEALSVVANQILEAKQTGKSAFWGGNPLTVEENFLFALLAREVAGTEHLDSRFGIPSYHSYRQPSPGMETGIGECESLDRIFLLGFDLTEEFPVIWLRLRQAINRGAKLFFFGHFSPEIAEYCEKVIVHSPGNELETIQTFFYGQNPFDLSDGSTGFFIGNQYLNSPAGPEISARLSELKKSAKSLSIHFMNCSGNSRGADLAGISPYFGPFGKKTENPGFNALRVLESAIDEGWDFIYTTGANPARKFPIDLWNRARAKVKFLVVQDLFLTETALEADVVLPALCYLEKEGTFLNVDGQLRPLKIGIEAPPGIYSDGKIFSLIAEKAGIDLTPDPETIDIMIEKHFSDERPPMPVETLEQTTGTFRTAKGEYLATFSRSLFDRGVRMRHNPHLIKMVKEPVIRIHPEDAEASGIKNGEIVFLRAEKTRVSGKVKTDDKVARSTAVIPLGFPEFPVYDLSPRLYPGMKIRIVKKEALNG